MNLPLSQSITLKCHSLFNPTLSLITLPIVLSVAVIIHHKSRKELLLLLKWTELGQFSIVLLAADGVRVSIGVILNPGVKKVGKSDSGSQNKSIPKNPDV